MRRPKLRDKTCTHDIGLLFVYHGKKAKEAWWCSVCDNDLYEDAGQPPTFAVRQLLTGKEA